MGLNRNRLTAYIFAVVGVLLLSMLLLDRDWSMFVPVELKLTLTGLLFLACAVGVLSLFSILMSEQLYRFWRGYSLVTIPLLTIIVAMSSSDGGNILYPSDKAVASIVAPILYAALFLPAFWALQIFKYVSRPR